MSFNQLPEELIAQVGSHVGREDMVSLLQTQRRINRVMKNYEMDRPKIEYIYLNFEDNKFTWQFRRSPIKDFSYLVKNLDRKEAVRYALSKFRSVYKVMVDARNVFNLDEKLVQIIMNSRTKVQIVSLQMEVDLHPKQLIEFSTKNFLLYLNCTENRPDIFNDEIFCQIASKNRFKFVLHMRNDALNLTDRWLDTMMSCNTQTDFHLHYVFTKFTIKGIKRYIEGSLSNESCMYTFGMLHPDQKKEALEWYNFARQHPHLEYSITDKYNDRSDYYIYRKNNDNEWIANFYVLPHLF